MKGLAEGYVALGNNPASYVDPEGALFFGVAIAGLLIWKVADLILEAKLTDQFLGYAEEERKRAEEALKCRDLEAYTQAAKWHNYWVNRARAQANITGFKYLPKSPPGGRL